MSRDGGPFQVRDGYIWPIEAVEFRPRVLLSSWRLYEVAHMQGEALSRHLVGYVLARDHGQVSSPVVRIDAAARCCVTHSGRIYELVGEPGYNEDAMYVWHRWTEVNVVVDVRDLTDELLQLLDGGVQKAGYPTGG